MIVKDIEKDSIPYDTVAEILYGLLCEFDRVCKKNEIQYYLAYGTLLGAVRDNNIIRWDEDVDVMITTDELNKLIAHRDDFSENYRLVLPEEYGENVYFNSIAHLNYEKAIVRKNSDENEYYHGLQAKLHVDLYHLSPVPSGIRAYTYSTYMCAVYAMANAFRYKNETNHYSKFMKASALILEPIGRVIGLRRIRRMIKRGLIKNDSLKDNKVHNNNETVRAMFTFFDRDDFEETAMVKIRDRLFPAPIGYDRILRKVYGDYMIPPPLADRGWKFIDSDSFTL